MKAWVTSAARDHEGGGEPVAYVVVSRHGVDEARVPLFSTVYIGRDAHANAICLPSRVVAHRHLAVVVKDGEIFGVDLKSFGGSYRNEQRLTAPVRLAATDTIAIRSKMPWFALLRRYRPSADDYRVRVEQRA